MTGSGAIGAGGRGGSASGRTAGPLLLALLLCAAVSPLVAQGAGTAPDESRSPAASGPRDGPGPPDDRPIAGVSLVAPRDGASPRLMAEARGTGAGWVAVVPYAFLRPGSGEVVFERPGRFRGERSEGIREQVALAREQGMRVLLKPHVWSRGLWVGEYVPPDEEAWRRWTEGYRGYLLPVARLAGELDVEMLAVGTELKETAGRRPGWMRELIAEVREVYGGELTYAANWDEYADVPFWEALDYIGVNAYFPLHPAPVPEVEALVRRWSDVLGDLETFSERVGRPVLVTEFGYRSVEGAAGPHWELPDRREARPTPESREAQARAYEAFFRAWWDEPWLAGAFLWKWFLEEPGRGWRGGRLRDTGFTPQGKPAEEVIRRWYGGR